jgi:hypothetical protein
MNYHGAGWYVFQRTGGFRPRTLRGKLVQEFLVDMHRAAGDALIELQNLERKEKEMLRFVESLEKEPNV